MIKSLWFSSPGLNPSFNVSLWDFFILAFGRQEDDFVEYDDDDDYPLASDHLSEISSEEAIYLESFTLSEKKNSLIL